MNFLKRFPLPFLLLIFLWLPGFLVSCRRGYLRMTAERENRYVESVVDFEEMRALCRKEGWTIPGMLQAAKEAGISSVAIPEDTLATLEAEGRISILNYQEIEKLSIENDIASFVADNPSSLGALWIYSREEALVDRIYQHLLWKLPADNMRTLRPNVLLVNKSGSDFRERVGVGFSDELLKTAANNKLGVVLRLFNFPGLNKQSLSWMISRLPSPASVSALLFADEEVLGNRGDIDASISALRERSYRIGLIEFHEQKGMDKYVSAMKVDRPFVRVHSINRKEIEEIYNVPRAIARWIRAVRDRSMKMLYIRCFFQDKKLYIDDLVKFNLEYIAGITKELKKYGYEIAQNEEERLHDSRHIMGRPTIIELYAVGLSLILGMTVLWLISTNGTPSINSCSVIALAVLAACILLPKNTFIFIAGLAGAIGYASLGCIWAVKEFITAISKQSVFDITVDCIEFMLKLVIPGILGGILISGLHSELPYMQKFMQFRGVKLALTIPVLWTFIWSLKVFGGGFLLFLTRPLTLKEVVIGLGVVAGLVLFVLRSGNITFLKPSEIEDLSRTFLENVLLARPRNKEFLIGYPAAIFLLFFLRRKIRDIIPILAVFTTVGQVSVINTFCHFHSPLAMSFMRTFNGFWMGLATGLTMLAVYCACRLTASLITRDGSVLLIGYFGFNNAGDEILRQSFMDEASKKLPDIKWKALVGDDSVLMNSAMVPVRRSCMFEILESIALADTVVIPGGGVFQSSTSNMSLLYYASLLFIARIFGTKTILAGQGLGPWNPKSESLLDSIVGKLAKDLAKRVLENCNYISVRDERSFEEFKSLNTLRDPESVIRSADMAFLVEPVERNPEPELPEKIRLGIILRSGSTDAKEIARLAIELKNDIENLVIIPMAFQEEEDETVWESEKVIRISAASEAVEAFRNLDLIFSMRLHGCIMATITSVPWFGLLYDSKIEAFARKIHWEFYAEPSEMNREKLEKSIESMMKKRSQLSAILYESACRLHSEALADIERCVETIRASETEVKF